jgi:putative membrane protein
MFNLSEFGITAAWSPVSFFLVAMIAVVYILAVGQYRSVWFKHSESVSLRKKAAMLGGLALFYLTHGGPLELAAHLMFSAHMVKMAISYLVVPPLLLYGIPDWMYRSVTKFPAIDRIVRRMTNPIMSVVMFNMLFSLYHTPIVMDYSMTHFAVQRLIYLALMITSLMMWWNVVAPLPEHERLSDVKKMGYVFINGVLLTPACALIIFADVPLYATYTDPAVWAFALGYCVPQSADAILAQFTGPEQFMIFDPLEDQQLGGILMKLVQEIMYGVILSYNFTRWYRRENRIDQIDPLPQIDSIDSIPSLK